MALGGRAAEEIVFGKISTGALSDLERITKMAYSIVSVYGMNKNIGNLSFFDSKQSDYNFTKPYSESTAEKIDQEVKRIIDNAYLRTKKLLIEKKSDLEKIATKLLEKEILFQNDLEKLIGKRPFKSNLDLSFEEDKSQEEKKTTNKKNELDGEDSNQITEK
jgi:cell division protease FtsH